MVSVGTLSRQQSIVALAFGEHPIATSITKLVRYKIRCEYAFMQSLSVAKRCYSFNSNSHCSSTCRLRPLTRSTPRTTTRLSFSSIPHRILSPRTMNSRYSDDSSYSMTPNTNDHHHHHHDHVNHKNDRYNSATSASTSSYYYSPYPLTVCGLQLSAVVLPNDQYSSENDNDGDDDGNSYSDSNNDTAMQRRHPPTFSDETSYGDGFGAYQYDYNDDTSSGGSSSSNSNNDDAYDQIDQPSMVRRQPEFIPKTTIGSKHSSTVAPQSTTNSSNRYDDNTMLYKSAGQPQRRQSTASTSTRPPVQVSIPGLSTNQGTQPLPRPIDVDLSLYDNCFDSSNEESPTTNVQIQQQPVPEEVKGEAPVKDVVSLPSTRPTFGESLIPTTHFHPGQNLNGLSGFDPALDQFLTKAAYGVGTTTSLDVLQEELTTIEQAVYERNNDQTFNINSPKQVAIVLFGTTSDIYSTNKEVLEGMAGGGNRLADLILQYRSIKYKLSKFVRQEESRKKGTAVRSALTVARPTQTTQSGTTKQQMDEMVTMNQTTTEQLPVVSEMRAVVADPLLLLDASAYIFRAYYSMPPIHRPDGMPTGAVMGFCKMLNSLLLSRMLEGEQPRLVLCFDAKGKTFRHEVYNKYKANRASAPMDLVPQFDLVRQAAKAYGICQIEAKRFEADDVIATLACKAIAEGVDANIMSGDKDLMQLVTELNATPSIQIIDPMKKERTTYQEVVEKWQVPPNKLGDLLALAGDTADNVPGVRGIGPKTAAKLINDFGSLENLLNNIDSVKQQGVRDKLYDDMANARLSRVLVELNCTVPMNELMGLPDGIHQKMSDLRMEAIDPDRIIDFYDQMGFKELKRSFQNSLKGVKVKRKKSSGYNKRVKATIPTPEDYKGVPF